MYLKSLEVQGFKSFANRVEFEFPSGISMIVGPNGSGKSNVVDAIRWVLGEQSVKSLRGGKQEDIIFAGSDKRKPVGMAQVSINLDNSRGIFPLDYNEITVTRRLYRSGESEFLINKVSCRLKDIHELFMDTGLGKESYSIIGQGKVEEIILAKPEERRFLIEETAGITKYRLRKQEATKKLTETEQNLVRVEDIIAELENQLEPLKMQSEAAQEFITYELELKGLELGLLTSQIGENRHKVTEFRQQLEDVKQQVLKKETSIAVLEAKNTEKKLELQQKNEALYQSQQAVFEVATSLERHESNIKVNEEKKNSLTQKLSSLSQEIDTSRWRLQRLQGDQQVEVDKLNKLFNQIKAEKQLLSIEEKRLVQLTDGFKMRRQEEEEAKDELIEVLNKVANCKNLIDKKEYEKESIEKRILQNKKDGQLFQANLDSILKEMETEAEKAEKLKRLIQERQEEVVQLSKKKQEGELELKEAVASLQQKQESFGRLTSRLKALSELKEDFEGYQKGVKEILQGRKKGVPVLQGVKGVVAEIIRVEKEKELAIEVALGGALQNIITDTDVSAKGAINFLKEKNRGRATFLPLNTVRPASLREEEKEVLNLEGVLGRAADLISCPKEFKPAIENLLGRILVVENIDCALKVAKRTGYRLKVVTLEGEILNPGGSLTGGSFYRKDSGLLSRNREIDELKENAGKAQKQIELYASKKMDLENRLNDIAQSLEQAKEDGQNLKYQLASVEKELSRLNQEKTKLRENLEELELVQVQLQHDCSQVEQLLSEFAGDMENSLATERELRERISSGTKFLAEEEETKNKISSTITDLKVKLAALEQQGANAEKNLDNLRFSIEELENAIKTKNGEIEVILGQQAEIRKSLDTLRAEIRSFFETKEKMEAEVAVGRDQIGELMASLEQDDNAVKVAMKEIQVLQQKEKELEVKEARFETELEACFKRLNLDFELTYEEALEQKYEISDKREANKRLKELKQKIMALGNVNLGSIEEYLKVKERYEFLTQQVLDLSNAKDSLYQVIKEMDVIIVKRFKETFEAIDEHFRRIFTELFAGGRAFLQMTNEENILETGIEIIAQPPGKKPQHLNLLSGGEKALTAIALLFAILKVKPSPFCVLDEIEASLDEANIDRFSEFLRAFAQDSQFIVISHRKGTMAAADVLYGITIDDVGVTKMVSLALNS